MGVSRAAGARLHVVVQYSSQTENGRVSTVPPLTVYIVLLHCSAVELRRADASDSEVGRCWRGWRKGCGPGLQGVGWLAGKGHPKMRMSGWDSGSMNA